jgi:uncharacterized membrane protein YedE/YeeE
MSPNFTPVSAIVGGALIGLSASGVLLGLGRIAGISGILASAMRPAPNEDGSWRLFFLAGFLGMAALIEAVFPHAIGAPVVGSYGRAVIAALFVGVGVELGSGCTSGHGVCGISRFSARSIVATMTFMATGIATVFACRHFGSAP